MKGFIGVYNAPYLVTMLGLFSAVSCCFLSFGGQKELAVIAFIFAGLFDLFDGVVARLKERNEKEAAFGLYIDSVVDAISFGLTPVTLLMAWGLKSVMDLILFCIYCLCATTRLAYFNVLQQSQKTSPSHYRGLPVTYSALIIPLVLTVGLFFRGSSFTWPLRITVVLLSFFFVYDVPVKKPKGVFYIIFPLLGLVLVTIWLLHAE
ncbi:MAG: CDP-diacylglycerol--serine O-phosphatidyltransferase [Thermodesulfobacteria bacterium]|nr:CDP-diacylglycerol--serine O-phosphatidyltransferase [Thermodesulfobacteriota bacterium]